MRIGILTQPLHNNYGGILQNYALQTVLKRLGHDPVTLNVQYPIKHISMTTRVIKFCWRLFKKLRGNRSILFCDLKQHFEFINRPGKEQQRFIDANINQRTFPEHLTKDFCKDNDFSAYIVGSDQVWRPRFSPYIANYFLDFTEGTDVKKLSYAASFGTDSWEGTPAETPKLASLARKFDAISVREKSGIKVCNDVFNAEATWVLDPTLLLRKSDYQSELKIEDKPTKTLAVYVLDQTPELDRLISRISTEKSLKVNIIGRPSRKGYPSIESWLDGIFNSEFVLTDSFHGTVFSILSHKQFATVINSGRGASRFESLLGSLDLMDRLMSEDKEFNDYTIDYCKVDDKLDEYRKLSLDFLNKTLNGNK